MSNSPNEEEIPSESEQEIDEKQQNVDIKNVEEKKQEEEKKLEEQKSLDNVNSNSNTNTNPVKKQRDPDDLDDDGKDDDALLGDEKKAEEKKQEDEKKKDDKESEKKKSKRQEKKEQEKKLKDWDKQDEDLCCDIDSRVPYNPEDYEPDYIKGRPRIKDELEDQMKLEPFETLDLYTGQAGGFKLFGAERRKMGKVKGLWQLSENANNPFGSGLKALVQTRTIACRLYVLRGIQLISTDSDNSSDPYLVVKLGKDKKSTRERYKKNTLNPYFHEAFEFHTKLPGPSQLIIEVWDWDGIGDDLVGTSEIDIENRWFSKDWRRLRLKPLEERTLHNPRSSAPYGKLSLWVDLLAKDETRDQPMIDISLPPPQKFEYRCIIWKAENVPIKDEITDQNDLRVTCEFKLGQTQKQETDTHWRAKFGKGSWNWRLIFPFELNGIFDKKSNFKMSLWDQDIFSANDSIGECIMSFDMILRKLWLHRETKPRLILRKDATKRFWLEMRHSEFEGPQGKIQVSMELLSEEEAKKFVAGTGRSDPNMNPFLPPPEGRLLWTLNPFTMLRQLLGDKLCAKLCGIVCLLACFAILVFFGPQLFINFMSNLALKAL